MKMAVATPNRSRRSIQDRKFGSFACTRCGNPRRSMWTRMTCRIGAEGDRVLRHR